MAVIPLHKIGSFEKLLSECTRMAFAEEVAERNGYGREELPAFLRIAREVVRECGRKGSFASRLIREGTEGEKPVTACVLTLGEGVDHLQDRYREKGDMTAVYMAEVISNEILMKSYAAYDRMLTETTKYRIAAFLFPGSSKECPLSDTEKIVTLLSAPVQCLTSFCMVPKKSVAFYAYLTEEKEKDCQSICETCSRKDCRHRREGKSGKEKSE